MQNTTNVFLKGMTSDFHPLATDNQTYTEALNATLLTYNGNEQMMQNDMGNTKIQDAKTGNIMGLREGMIPVGMKEHGGIMYIASVDKDGVGEIGTIPSPVIRFNKSNKITSYYDGDSREYGTLSGDTQIININKLQDTSEVIQITNEKIYPGEKFVIALDLSDTNDVNIQYANNIKSEYIYGSHTTAYTLDEYFENSKWSLTLESVTTESNTDVPLNIWDTWSVPTMNEISAFINCFTWEYDDKTNYLTAKGKSEGEEVSISLFVIDGKVCIASSEVAITFIPRNRYVLRTWKYYEFAIDNPGWKESTILFKKNTEMTTFPILRISYSQDINNIKYPLFDKQLKPNGYESNEGLYDIKLYSISDGITDISSIVNQGGLKLYINGIENNNNDWYYNTSLANTITFDTDKMLINDLQETNALNSIPSFLTYPNVKPGYLGIVFTKKELEYVQLNPHSDNDQICPITIANFNKDNTLKSFTIAFPEIWYKTNCAVHIDKMVVSVTDDKQRKITLISGKDLSTLDQELTLQVLCDSSENDVKRYISKDSEDKIEWFKLCRTDSTTWVSSVDNSISNINDYLSKTLCYFTIDKDDINQWFSLNVKCYNDNYEDCVYTYELKFNQFVYDINKQFILYKLVPESLVEDTSKKYEEFDFQGYSFNITKDKDRDITEHPDVTWHATSINNLSLNKENLTGNVLLSSTNIPNISNIQYTDKYANDYIGLSNSTENITEYFNVLNVTKKLLETEILNIKIKVFGEFTYTPINNYEAYISFPYARSIIKHENTHLSGTDLLWCKSEGSYNSGIKFNDYVAKDSSGNGDKYKNYTLQYAACGYTANLIYLKYANSSLDHNGSLNMRIKYKLNSESVKNTDVYPVTVMVYVEDAYGSYTGDVYATFIEWAKLVNIFTKHLQKHPQIITNYYEQLFTDKDNLILPFEFIDVEYNYNDEEHNVNNWKSLSEVHNPDNISEFSNLLAQKIKDNLKFNIELTYNRSYILAWNYISQKATARQLALKGFDLLSKNNKCENYGYYNIDNNNVLTPANLALNEKKSTYSDLLEDAFYAAAERDYGTDFKGTSMTGGILKLLVGENNKIKNMPLSFITLNGGSLYFLNANICPINNTEPLNKPRFATTDSLEDSEVSIKFNFTIVDDSNSESEDISTQTNNLVVEIKCPLTQSDLFKKRGFERLIWVPDNKQLTLSLNTDITINKDIYIGGIGLYKVEIPQSEPETSGPNYNLYNDFGPKGLNITTPMCFYNTRIYKDEDTIKNVDIYDDSDQTVHYYVVPLSVYAYEENNIKILNKTFYLCALPLKGYLSLYGTYTWNYGDDGQVVLNLPDEQLQLVQYRKTLKQ